MMLKANKNENAEPILHLKVPENKKTLENFYKPIMDYIVPFETTAVSDYQKMRNNYAIVNNDLSLIKKELDAMCKPLGPLFDFPGMVDDEIVVYNKIFPKYMYLVGQMSKRGDNLNVVLTSDSANKQKTEELRKEILTSIDEKILLSAEMDQMRAEGASDEELEKYYIQMRTQAEPEDINVKEFRSEAEIFWSDVKDYFNYKFNVKRKKELSFKHVLASDRCAVAIVSRNGKPEPQVLNSIHYGFHKSPDLEYTQNGDYWWYKTAVSYAQAYTELINHPDVKDGDLDRISTYTGVSSNRPNEAWDVKGGKAFSQKDYSIPKAVRDELSPTEKHIGQSMGSGTNKRFNSERLVWKTYMEFKAFREIIFLRYTDQYGEVIDEIVPGNYEIPKEAVKNKFTNKHGMKSYRWEWTDDFGNSMYAEKQWIPRRYECTRWGSDIYTDYREVPNQPLSIDDFELSAKGKVFTSVNSEPISLVERASSSLMQYIFVKNLQNRELAKYEGYIRNVDVQQIPDYLTELRDDNGNLLWDGKDKLAIARYLRRKIGDNYYDPDGAEQGLVNYQKSTPVKPEISGAIGEIINMQNLLDLIDREMGLQMLVPPQAEGIVTPYSNVADNQQALQQGYIQAEPYFLEHNEVWRQVTNEYLKQFREYYLNFFENNPETTETFLNYVTPEGSKVLKVTPDLLQHEDIGIFLHDSSYAEDYKRWMLNSGAAQAMAQNRGEGTEIISSLIMAISRGDNPEAVHKMITLAALKQQKRADEMQKAAQEAELRKEQEITAREERSNEVELEKTRMTNESRERAALIGAYRFRELEDTDQDDIPQALEAAKILKDMQLKEREVRVKEKKVEKDISKKD